MSDHAARLFHRSAPRATPPPPGPRTHPAKKSDKDAGSLPGRAQAFQRRARAPEAHRAFRKPAPGRAARCAARLRRGGARSRATARRSPGARAAARSRAANGKPGPAAARPMRAAALLALVLLAGCTQAPPPAPAAPAAPVRGDALRFELDLGTVDVWLYPQAAPRTVALMQQLAGERYFDGREFNRVVPEFVIQLVDKAGGATDDPRTVPLEAAPGYHFSAGAAGIARGSDPDRGGPEFFLMDFAASHLDGNYTVWGQVLRGLDVVHRAARVPAVQTGDVPVLGTVASDRMPIQAPTIRSARLVQVELPGEQAAKLPMQAAPSVRSGDERHNLEWPRDLRAGAASELTWYIHSYNGTSPPQPGEVRIAVEGAQLPVRGDDAPGVPGVYHWTWAPRSPGTHDATLLRNGTAVATLQVEVRS